jgi:hypothetical protein
MRDQNWSAGNLSSQMSGVRKNHLVLKCQTNYQLPITNYPLPITHYHYHYPLPIPNYQVCQELRLEPNQWYSTWGRTIPPCTGYSG